MADIRNIFVRKLITIKSISELNPSDAETLEGRTYTLNCNGAVGNMLYLTDLDYEANPNVGHNIAEVLVYGTGEDGTPDHQ